MFAFYLPSLITDIIVSIINKDNNKTGYMHVMPDDTDHRSFCFNPEDHIDGRCWVGEKDSHAGSICSMI